MRSVCKTGAFINGVGNLFANSDTIDLRCQENVFLLKDVDKLPSSSDQNDTSIIKQRSEKWFSERKTVKVTGSTAFQALGCDTLKKQKEHYNVVVLGKQPCEPNQFQRTAMQHGTDCEINQIATLSGLVLPFLFPDLKYCEEGYYKTNDVIVSPDGSIRNSEGKALF